MDEAKVLEINSIQEHDKFFGVESRNPMISIIDVSKFDYLEYVPIRFGIYAIICYIDSDELNSENNIISATCSVKLPDALTMLNIISIDCGALA